MKIENAVPTVFATPAAGRVVSSPIDQECAVTPRAPEPTGGSVACNFLRPACDTVCTIAAQLKAAEDALEVGGKDDGDTRDAAAERPGLRILQHPRQVQGLLVCMLYKYSYE